MKTIDSLSITLTHKAIQRLLIVNNQQQYLRLRIVGGGCAGFEYQFSAETQANDDDFVFIHNDQCLFVIDPTSGELVKNGIIDYISDFSRNQFIVLNPNEKTNCGCGVSFGL